MKLRIKGNTIRLRLTRPEVGEFTEKGKFSEKVGLTPNQLVYSIEKTEAEKVTARFTSGELTVFVPVSIADKWAEGEQIGIEGNQPIYNNELHIIIEKDFACLTPREGEDTADHYPHPKTAHC